MKSVFATLLSLGLTALTLPSLAAERAWLASVPHALSSEQIYKVRIMEIDGEAREEWIRYAVLPGRHTVRVRMMLRVDWEPEFAEAPRGPGDKELVLDVERGKTYLIGAKFDPDAPIEAQLDQSYWRPFVYAVK